MNKLALEKTLLEEYAGQVAPMMFRRIAEANEHRNPENKFRLSDIHETVSKSAFTFAEAMIREAEKRYK